MQMRKLKQFGLVLSCIVSLFASSFAMCVCSHHGENSETQAAANSHHHGEEGNEQASHHHTDKTVGGDESGGVFFSEPECQCIQRATLKTIAKSETVKIKKHLAELSISTPAALLPVVWQDNSVELIFTKPLYLSDSFYNLTPGRAPPRL
jgi:hypothetical protein